jgi:hypothetical protein
MNFARGFRLVPALAAVAALAAAAAPLSAQEAPDFRKEWTTPLPGSEEGIPLPPVEVARTPLFRGRLENVGYGPLQLASQSPMQSFRLGIPGSMPSSLAQGGWEVRETTAWSKIWGQTDQYLLDYESVSTTHALAYGVTDDLQVELGVVEVARFGGSLDGFVRGFHKTFGIAQDGRDQFPIGAYHFEVRGRNGAAVAVPEDRTNSSTEYLYFSVHRTLTAGSDFFPALSVSLSVKGDLRESRDVSGSGIEGAGSISLAKKLGDFYAYVSIGMGEFGSEEFHGLGMRPRGMSVLAAVEWTVTDNASIVFQQLRSEGALRGYGHLSAASTEISLGIKVEAAAGVVFELGVIENIIVFDNSPDFGLHFGLTLRQ